MFRIIRPSVTLFVLCLFFYQKSSAITNGATATGNESWSRSVVGLAVKDADGLAIYCTGVLVGPRTVISVAHCLQLDADDHDPRYIVFGLSLKDPKARLIPIDRTDIVYHEEYGKRPRKPEIDQADFGLVRLSVDAPQGYKPARIVSNMDDLTDGIPTLTAGYGVLRDDVDEDRGELSGKGILRSIDVRIRDRSYGTEEIVTDDRFGGPASGDSGGPAFISKEGRFYLWGIVGRENADKSDSTVFTVVSKFKNWIDLHRLANRDLNRHSICRAMLADF